MRLIRGLSILLVVSLLLVATPPASADDTIATLARPASVSAHAGRVVWSSFDPARNAFALMTRFEGVTSEVPVEPRVVPFDVDLGPDRNGATVAVYSRCKREPPPRNPAIGNVFAALPDRARGRGCDLYEFDFARGRVSRLTRANSPGASEFLPSIWRDRLAFARVYERKRGRAGERAYLYARSLTSHRPSLRLPGGTRSTLRFCSSRPRRCRFLVEPGPTALDLRGSRLGLVWDSGESEGPSSSLYLERIRSRRATKQLFSRFVSGETQAAEITSPSIADDQLYWTLAEFGHDARNRLFRTRISNLELAEAPLPPPAVQAQDAYLRGTFATAVDGPDVFYLVSGRTIPGEPCMPQSPCSVEPGCSDAEPCPLRSTRDIAFRLVR